MIDIYILNLKQIWSVTNKNQKSQKYVELYFLKLIFEKLTNEDFKGIKKNKYGKPYFIGKPNLEFNISHSQEIIAIGFCSFELGLDLERKRNINPILLEAFTEKEKKKLENLNLRKTYKLAKYWTYKESYLKLIGTGLFTDTLSFSIDFSKNKLDDSISTPVVFKEIKIPNYYLTICLYKDDYQKLNYQQPRIIYIN